MNDLIVTEYNGIRVLTTQQIAEAYGTEERRISENFNANKNRYKEGKHYICLKGEELKEFLQSANSVVQNPSKVRQLYLWTEKGAFLHAKSLNTDVAWEVYERLVDSYFNRKKVLTTAEQIQILAKGNLDLEQKVDNISKDLQDFKQEMPLLGVDMDEVTHAVHVRGVNALGGKNSLAYQNKSLRQQVYKDIYKQLKYQFNVQSYKALARNQLQQALAIIEEYELPVFLQNAIIDENNQMRLGV